MFCWVSFLYPTYKIGDRTNDEPPLTGGTEPIYRRWYEGGMEIISVRELENRLNADPMNKARGITYDFLSNVPKAIQDIIETQPFTWLGDDPINAFPILSANLLADIEKESTILNTAIWHNGVTKFSFGQTRPFQISTSQVNFPENAASQISSSQISSSQISSREIASIQISPTQVNPCQISSPESGAVNSHLSQVSFSQISTVKTGITQISPSEIGTSQISTVKTGLSQSGITEINSLESSTSKMNLFHPISTQVSTTQVNISTIVVPRFDISKVAFTSSIFLDQLFSVHNTPQIINNLNNTATNIWSNLLQSQTSLDITFQITDLPTGQLAEATITGFDPFGRPKAGIIRIDYNANGVGWFIDSTPEESSEFGVQSSEFSYNATPNSEAYGKYDLLTTLLHEIAHLYGFIEGYEPFDHLHHDHATLHGEHLDNHAHPYDLLNTHLAPGIRKLPSDIDIEILKAILANADERHEDLEHLEALLTSNPLLAAIANGNFNISDPYHPNFGWTTRGATTIFNGQALLKEGSPFLSNLSQTFIIPEGAKTLQFTLVDAQLGSTQSFPSDAFEVALLDAHSLTSLVDTIDELSFTDAFFNLQNTGTTYFGDDLQLAHGTENSPRTFSINISHLTPGTEATLYFDLLGFGDNDSRVLIDDVFIQREIFPITVNNPVTLNQGQSTVINVFPDNSNLTEILQTYTIQIQTPAENGTVNIAENGTFIYTPTDGNGTE